MRWCIIKEEEALCPAVGELFEDIDRMLGLRRNVIMAKVTFTILTGTKEDARCTGKETLQSERADNQA